MHTSRKPEIVRGSKPVSPDQVPIPEYDHQKTSRTIITADAMHTGAPFQISATRTTSTKPSQAALHLTIEDLGFWAAEGGDSNYALALDFTIAEKLHGGAGGSRSHAA